MLFNMQSQECEVAAHVVRLLGATAAISIDTDGGGDGITVTRTGAGAYTLTFSDNPGVFQGFGYALGAATPANVAGHTVVRDTYDASTYSLDIVLYNAADAEHDLVALEYIDLVLYFKG